MYLDLLGQRLPNAELIEVCDRDIEVASLRSVRSVALDFFFSLPGGPLGMWGRQGTNSLCAAYANIHGVSTFHSWAVVVFWEVLTFHCRAYPFGNIGESSGCHCGERGRTQGKMISYVSELPSISPLPLSWSHRLTIPWIGSSGKDQCPWEGPV